MDVIMPQLGETVAEGTVAKWHKKVFGKHGETPSSEHGMAFFSTKIDEDRPRRRHEMTFHARVGDGPSMTFVSRPGTFSYGRFDHGSRAMLEVAEVREGDHVLDLGCGNGAVGCLASAKAGPTGRVTFIDSNLRALALEVQLTMLGIAAIVGTLAWWLKRRRSLRRAASDALDAGLDAHAVERSTDEVRRDQKEHHGKDRTALA